MFCFNYNNLKATLLAVSPRSTKHQQIPCHTSPKAIYPNKNKHLNASRESGTPHGKLGQRHTLSRNSTVHPQTPVNPCQTSRRQWNKMTTKRGNDRDPRIRRQLNATNCTYQGETKHEFPICFVHRRWLWIHFTLV